MESLRYLPYLSPGGWLITNTKPFINIPTYPDIEKILGEIRSIPHHIALDADSIAKDAGSVRAANTVILGAASPFLDMEYEKFESAIRYIFRNKGDKLIQMNLVALKAGRDYADNHMDHD